MKGREWRDVLLAIPAAFAMIVLLAVFWIVVLGLLVGGAIFLGLAIMEPNAKDLLGLTIGILMLIGGVCLLVVAISRFVRRKSSNVDAVAKVSQQSPVEPPIADPGLRDRPTEKRESPEQFKIKVARCVGASFVTIPGSLYFLGWPSSFSDVCSILAIGAIAAVVSGMTSQLKWPHGKPIKLMKFRARTVGQALLEGSGAGFVIPVVFGLLWVMALAVSDRRNGPTFPGGPPSSFARPSIRPFGLNPPLHDKLPPALPRPPKQDRAREGASPWEFLDPERKFRRAETYAEKGEYDQAVAAYSEAIRLRPNYAEAYYGRALAYQKKGDSSSAEVDFARAKQLGFQPE